MRTPILIRRFPTVASLAVLALAAGRGAAAECNVDLRVQITEEFDCCDHPYLPEDAVTVVLRNNGSSPVVLVEPGDGSGDGWRPPILSWEVSRDGKREKISPAGVRCGNINPLTASEVFELQPGEEHRLRTWIPPLEFKEPGTYGIRLHYVNDPQRKWQGVPLGEPDEQAMKRLRHSTACDLVSEAVEVRILRAGRK